MAVKKITSIERVEHVRREIAALVTAGLPTGWQSWSCEKTDRFKTDYRQVFAVGSPAKVLPLASRIAGLYGRDMATIDPCHGQEA